jgi:predicted nucleic acid-binding protein
VIAPDVNVLLYAFREDSARHAEYHAWLQNTLNGTEPVALFEPVLSAVLRIATHPGIFNRPVRAMRSRHSSTHALPRQRRRPFVPKPPIGRSFGISARRRTVVGI